jgi:oligosaccharide repeat unit polymerase
MDAVPEHLSWRLGYTYMQPLLTVLPGHQTTFDQDIKTALNQTYPGGGTVPTFLGESYANFGPPGWFAVPLVLGFLLVWLYRRALARNDPAWWTLYAYAIVAVVNANLGGLSVASIFPVMGLVVLIFAIAGKPLMRAATQRLR